MGARYEFLLPVPSITHFASEDRHDDMPSIWNLMFDGFQRTFKDSIYTAQSIVIMH